MHVLIIGGIGFMGPRVVRLLHKQGHTIAIFHCVNEAFKRAVEWERANPPKEIDPKQFDYEAEDAALAKVKKAIRVIAPHAV